VEIVLLIPAAIAMVASPRPGPPPSGGPAAPPYHHDARVFVSSGMAGLLATVTGLLTAAQLIAAVVATLCLLSYAESSAVTSMESSVAAPHPGKTTGDGGMTILHHLMTAESSSWPGPDTDGPSG
jgi:hypothetical protein